MSIDYGYQKMFDTRKGLECLPETEAAPKKERLFGEFFYKNELAVLCGPEGSGRSILAMQIADSISRGVPISGFTLDTEARPVVFLDIEGNQDEFARRYSLDGKQPYPFHDNFNIVRFHQNFRGYTSMRKDFLKELNTTVARHKEGVLIINNLDYWKCFMSEAYALAAIKELQANSRLSVLLISSLKGNPKHKQLTPNRAGKLLTTMTDSIFAMNFSLKDADTRYLLQLKTKGGKPVYHPNHVAEFSLVKARNFTGCQFTGFGTEQEHIAMPPTDFEMKIIELSLNKPELRLAEIADQLKTNKVRVDRVLKKFDVKQVKRMETVGGVVTSTFKNESSNTEILNSKSALDEATTDEKGHGSTILCHAEAERGLEARQRIVGSESQNLLVKSDETVDTLVTSTFTNDKVTEDTSFSIPRLQPGDTIEEDDSSPCPLLLPTTPAQGGQPNAEPETHITTKIDVPTPLPPDPFRGEVELSDHTSKSGVNHHETFGTLVTSTFINENSNTEILNSKSALAKATADEEGHGSTILCHAEAEGGLEARQRIVGSESQNLLVKSDETVDTLVTSTFTNDAATGDTSFNNPRLQPGDTSKDDSSPNPLLSLTTSAQGGMPNAEPETLEGLLTSTFKNENSNTEILNSKSALDEATTDEEGHGSTILCHAEAEGGLEARQRIVGNEAVSDETLGTLVTSTFENENSDTEILNSKSAFAEATADEEGHGSAILCHAEAEGGLEARQRIVGSESKNPLVKSDETVDNLVTSTFINDAATGDTSFSNPRLQPGDTCKDDSSPNPLLSLTTPAQGGQPHAEPGTLITTVIDVPTLLPPDSFRDEVELPDHTSKSGVAKTPTPLLFDPVKWKYKPSDRPSPPEVNQSPEDLAEALKTLDAMISSHCKSPPPKTPETEAEKIPFSQRVKKQIAQNNIKRLKGK